MGSCWIECHPIPLARPCWQGYRPGVIDRAFLLFATIALVSSCRDKPTEVTVTETRTLTTRDTPPKLDAASDERFRDARPSPVKAETPAGWLALPSTQMRLLNYRFGESGLGEVWVTIASGTVPDNVNRWLSQFGAAGLDADGQAKLRSVPIAGATGTWVEAAGEYAAGMGAPPKPGYALAGVVSMIGERILTVKMIGPAAEVQAAKSTLENFARDLKMAD
jgi:hypothetical protein